MWRNFCCLTDVCPSIHFPFETYCIYVNLNTAVLLFENSVHCFCPDLGDLGSLVYILMLLRSTQMLSIVMEVLVPLCTILGGYLSGFLFDEMKVKNKLKLDNIGMCSNADA